MIDRGLLKHSIPKMKPTDLKIGRSEERGEVIVEGFERIFVIEPLRVYPDGEAEHLITTIKRTKVGKLLDSRYKEMSQTTKGLFMLYVALAQYFEHNEMFTPGIFDGILRKATEKAEKAEGEPDAKS